MSRWWLTKPSRNFVDATVPFFGDDSQYRTDEYMAKHGMKPEDLELLRGNNYTLQDLLVMQSFKDNLLRRKILNLPGYSEDLSADAKKYYKRKRR